MSSECEEVTRGHSVVGLVEGSKDLRFGYLKTSERLAKHQNPMVCARLSFSDLAEPSLTN